MDIIRGIKDFFLLSPYFVVLFIGVVYHIIIHLLFGFMGLMIFIYERLQWR
jgi:hypothetical protein